MASDNADRIEKDRHLDNLTQSQFFFWEDATEMANDSPHMYWQYAYAAIAAANAALQAIEVLYEAGAAPGSLDSQKAEALIARAYSHFNLANVFCLAYNETTSDTDLGIPYTDAPETTVRPVYERGTVAGLYARINADIEAALPLFVDSERRSKYRFNRRSAYAFAARFNLFYRNYDNAIEYATEALGTNAASTLRNWRELPNEYLSRKSFYLNTDITANYLVATSVSNWGAINGPYSPGKYYTHSEFLARGETNLSRGPWGTEWNIIFRPFIYMIGVVADIKGGYYMEFTDPIAQIGFIHNVHVPYTADETLLVRAEAHALKGDLDLALADMRIFMAGYTTGPQPSISSIVSFYSNMSIYKPDEPTPMKPFNVDFEMEDFQHYMVQYILHARRILTRGEGLRWFDVKRYGIEIWRRSISDNNEVTVLDFLPKDDPRRAIQLPIDVINAGMDRNPRLATNPMLAPDLTVR
jgi:hypothetical protein